MLEKIIFYALLLCAIALTILFKKLTPVAAIVGGLLAILIYFGSGYIGVAMLATFFIVGTFATSWKHKLKERIGVAELNKGQRTTGQVFANAGMAAILSILVFIFPTHLNLLQILIAACFSSATADTLSSEMGNIYGRKYFNILNFKKDSRGLNGVISLEGTLFGLAGSVIIAAIYAFVFGGWQQCLIIIVAGTIGNLSDSILGATVERTGTIGNNAVNFINTAIAAASAFLLMLLN